MQLRRILYCFLFAFFIWLALATRNHRTWFHPFMVKYGGDIIWAGAFLVLLRIFFMRTALWKLAVWCYLLGVLNELSQLIRTDWADNIRNTTAGRLLFGAGFLWSDLLCYAAGTLLAWLLIWLAEPAIFGYKKGYPKTG